VSNIDYDQAQRDRWRRSLDWQERHGLSVMQALAATARRELHPPRPVPTTERPRFIFVRYPIRKGVTGEDIAGVVIDREGNE